MKLSNGNPNGQIHSVNHSVNLPPSRFLANTGSGSSVTIEMLQKIFLVLFARKKFRIRFFVIVMITKISPFRFANLSFTNCWRKYLYTWIYRSLLYFHIFVLFLVHFYCLHFYDFMHRANIKLGVYWLIKKYHFSFNLKTCRAPKCVIYLSIVMNLQQDSLTLYEIYYTKSVLIVLFINHSY